ncbi:hypothetical protein TeGR_g11842 [Tetraparma gracilis]|uniref:SAM domain-containing protein n=1 Tax=Tetraparma gracilis TaxID=2962635 RepID=A0ABQ6N506_9STRA|nr:hypothetical protein TeGR_g11842 [Tetraparma gracilis]
MGADTYPPRYLASTDEECEWSYWNRQCEPVVDCEYAYEFGDLTLTQSCRIRTEPAPDTPSPTPDVSCGSDSPDDNCCGWSYGTGSCIPEDLCMYSYSFGDLSLTQSCRVNPDRDASGTPDVPGPESTESALESFLKKLTVSIPDQSFEEQTGVAGFDMATLTMDLTDLVCKNAFVGSMSASEGPDSSMAYSVGGIGATCSGTWAYTYGILSGEGYLTVILGDTSAALTMQMVKDPEDYYVMSVGVPECAISVNIARLDFGGSLEANIVDLFSGAIELFIETSLDEIVCNLAQDGISDAINPLLADFNENISKPMIANAPDMQPVVPAPSPYIDWPSQGWLDMVDFVVDLIGVCLPINDMVGIFLDAGELSLQNLNITQNVTIPSYANLDLMLNFVNITGLDTFSEFDVLQYDESPIARHTLTEKLDLDNFGVAVGAGIYLTPLEQLAGSVPLFEQFAISLEISQLKTHIVNFLAMTGTEVGPLHVEQLIASPTCLMKSVDSANFTDLGVSVSIDTFQLDGVNVAPNTLEGDINEFVNVFADVMLDDFNPWVTDFIGGALQGPVKTLVNQKLNNLVVTADDTCAAHEVWASDEFEFLELDKIPEIMLPPSSDPSSASDAASLIGKDLMDRIVDGFLSPSGINSFIDCFVQALVGGGGTVVDVAPMDGFRIQIKDAFVNGMDSFYALDLSIPDPYSVRAGVGLGDSSIKDFSFGMTVVIEFGDSVDTMDIKFTFSDLLLELQLMMKMRVASLMNMQVDGLSTSGCLLSTVEEMELNDLLISMGDVEIDIKTTTLTSSARWLYGGTQVSELLNKIFAAMFWGAKPVVNDLGGMFLKSSAETCANNGVPVPKEKELTPVESALAWISFITAQNLLLVLCFVLLWYMYRFKSNKTARKKKIELAKKCMDEGKMDDAEKLLNTIKPKTNWNTAMLFHPDISPAVRYGVVFIQCCLFILFLWANLNPGASVDLYLKIANDPIVIEDLFLFTLGGTISDMLNAGVYALAIIIILFSGCYPYFKVATQLYCWCMPTDWLPPKKREGILLFVGAIGKWSLVDTFVLFLMMVAFNMRIALQEGEIRADVFIVTKFGFYGFLFATMASLSMGSVVLWFHRYTTNYVEVEEGGDKISLSDMKHRYGKLLVKSTDRGRTIVAVVLTATALLMIGGSFIPSFAFDIQGLAGMAVELSPDSSPNNKYSLVTMGLIMPYATLDPNDLAIRWCQVTYFVFSLVCPLGYLVCIWLLWNCKFTLSKQRTIYVMAEVFSEWAAMEVFVISIIACSAQIGKLAYFMVGGACDQIDVILQEAMKVDDEIKHFGVAANLELGAYILLLACIIFTVLGKYLQEFCRRGLEDRLHEAPAARDHRAITRRLSAVVNPASFLNRDDSAIPDDPDFMSEDPVHKKEKIGWFNRNMFHLCDMIGMVEIIDETNDERVTLGFRLEAVEEEVDGVRGEWRRNTATSVHNPENERHFAFRPGADANNLNESERSGLSSGSETMMRKDIQNCALNQLDVAQVCAAMEGELKLGQYKEAFLTECIDGPVLVAMALDADGLEDMLKEELMIKSGLHRSKIKAWIAKNMR